MIASRGAAFGALLLLATASQAANQPDDRLVPGQGGVLMTVAVDYPASIMVNAAMPQLIPDLSVERVDEPGHAQYVLSPRLEGLQSARAYAGSLPPGRYRIRDLMGSKCQIWCGRDTWLPKATDLAEFKVVAGEVTWLGSIMTRVEPKLPGKDWVTRWAYEDAPDLAIGQRLLNGLYPQLAATRPVLAIRWQPFGPGAQAAADARAAMRRNANGLYEFSEWGGDGFCFGAQHGVGKCWSPARGFQRIETGSPYVLRSVLRFDGGRMLAVGEASTLLYSEDDGAHWRDAGASLPWGVVAQAESIGGDELLFTLVSGQTVRLYRGRLADLDWKQVGEYTLEFKFWTGLPGVYPAMFVQGRKVALTLPSKSGVFLDLDTGESHRIMPPGSIAAMQYSADGVMRCSCARTIAVNPWDSVDEGRSFQDSPVDRWMVLPVFRDKLEGFSFKGAWLSAKNTAVMGTKDGGKTWTPLAKPAAQAWWSPAYSRDGSVMVLTGMSLRHKYAVEEVQVSTDGGQSWRLASQLPEWLPEAAGSNAPSP